MNHALFQIGHKSEKWQWRDNIRYDDIVKFCWRRHVSLSNLVVQISCQYHYWFWNMKDVVYKGEVERINLHSTPD